MSETKFTPGPWVAIGQGGTHDYGSNTQHPGFIGNIKAEDGTNICQHASFQSVGGKTPEEAEANARLIAAAPDLLEALDVALMWAYKAYEAVDPDFKDEYNRHLRMGRNALRKARGEQPEADDDAE